MTFPFALPNHVVLVRLTRDQCIFWPRLPPDAGPTCVNFVHATNAANHYATPPTRARACVCVCVCMQDSHDFTTRRQLVRSVIQDVGPSLVSAILNACLFDLPQPMICHSTEVFYELLSVDRAVSPPRLHQSLHPAVTSIKTKTTQKLSRGPQDLQRD